MHRSGRGSQSPAQHSVVHAEGLEIIQSLHHALQTKLQQRRVRNFATWAKSANAGAQASHVRMHTHAAHKRSARIACLEIPGM